MRRIHRVRVTLVALIPPAQGVRANLYNVGPSRVVAPGLAGMETKVLPPSYDMISFSAPAGATGLFELNPPGDLRLPFEGVGVDTSWLFLGRHDGSAQVNPTLSGADLNGDGLISTRQPNGLAWLNNLVGEGAAPMGRWTLELPESFRQALQKGEIEDLFLSIAFKGRPQAWPPLTRASQLGG